MLKLSKYKLVIAREDGSVSTYHESAGCDNVADAGAQYAWRFPKDIVMLVEVAA